MQKYYFSSVHFSFYLSKYRILRGFHHNFYRLLGVHAISGSEAAMPPGSVASEESRKKKRTAARPFSSWLMQ